MSSVEDFLRNRFGSEADNLLNQIDHVSSLIENSQSFFSDSTHTLSSVKYIDQHLQLAPDNSGYSLTINKQFDKAAESQIISNLKQQVEKLRKLYASKSQQVKKLKQKLKQALSGQKIVQKPIFQEIIKQKIVSVNVQVPVEKIVEVPKQIVVKEYIEVQKPCQKCATENSKISQQSSPEPKKGKKKNFIAKQDAQKKKSIQNIVASANQEIKIVAESNEKPKIIQVERIIQVQKIIEKTIPVERIIQVQKIVQKQVPIQKIIEIYKTVEVPVQKIVEVRVQVQKTVEVPVQKIVYQQIIVEKQVPVQKIVEVPVQKIVEVRVQVQKIVEVRVQVQKTVEVPVQKIVEVRVEVQKVVEVAVQKIVYQQIIVEKQVPVQKIVEIEKIVQVPIHNLVQVQKIIEIPVQKIVEVEKIIQKIVLIPQIVEHKIYVPMEVIVEQLIPIKVEKIVQIEKIVEKVIENPLNEQLQQQLEKSHQINEQLTNDITKITLEIKNLQQNLKSIIQQKEQLEIENQQSNQKYFAQIEQKNQENKFYQIRYQEKQIELNNFKQQLQKMSIKLKIQEQEVVLGQEYKRQLQQYKQNYREVLIKTQQLLSTSEQQQLQLRKAMETIDLLTNQNNDLKNVIGNLENQLNSNNLILSQEKKFEEAILSQNNLLKERIKQLQEQAVKIQMPMENQQKQAYIQYGNDSNYQTPRKALITSKSTDNMGLRTSREASAGKSQRNSRIAYHYNNQECLQANIKKQLGQCSQKSLYHIQQFQKLLKKHAKTQGNYLEEIMQKVHELIISLDHKDKMVNQLKAIIQELQQQIKQKQTKMTRNSRVTNSRKKVFDEDYYESLAKVLTSTEKALEKCQCQKLQMMKRNQLLEDQIRLLKQQMKKTYDPQTQKLIEQLIAKYQTEKKNCADFRAKFNELQRNTSGLERAVFERDERINYLNFVLIKKQGKKTLQELNQTYKNQQALYYRQQILKHKAQVEQLRQRLKLLVSTQYSNYQITGAEMINSQTTLVKNSKNSK